MTILVTGATETVGRHLVDRPIEAGQRLRALTRDPAKADLSDRVEIVAADLTKPATLKAALDGVTGVRLLSASGDDHAPLQTVPLETPAPPRASCPSSTTRCSPTPTVPASSPTSTASYYSEIA